MSANDLIDPATPYAVRQEFGAGMMSLSAPKPKSGIPPFTLRLVRNVVKNCRPVRDQELLDLALLHDGDPRIIHNERFFPKKAGTTPPEWEAIKTLLRYVNLVKPATRRFTAAVYGGTVQRTIEDAGELLEDLLAAIEAGSPYAQDSRAHFENGCLFGTGVRAWMICEDGTVDSWMPNPVYTHILANPRNIRDVWGVFEYNPRCKELLFLTREGNGILRENGAVEWTAQDMGFLPASIGYGIDRRHRGELYGMSMVREASPFSLRISDATLNLALLQKFYTRCLLAVSGSVEDMDLSGAFDLHGLANLGPDGKLQYISPDAKFTETIEVISNYIGLLCTILGLPRDAFDSQIAPNGDSAESARLRSMPLTSQARFSIEEWRQVECDVLLRRAGVAAWKKKREPVDLAELRKTVKFDVQIAAASVPESFAEEVSSWTQLLTAGGKTACDFARHFNPTKSDAAIEEMERTIEARAAAAAAKPPVFGGRPTPPPPTESEAPDTGGDGPPETEAA